MVAHWVVLFPLGLRVVKMACVDFGVVFRFIPAVQRNAVKLTGVSKLLAVLCVHFARDPCVLFYATWYSPILPCDPDWDGLRAPATQTGILYEIHGIYTIWTKVLAHIT